MNGPFIYIIVIHLIRVGLDSDHINSLGYNKVESLPSLGFLACYGEGYILRGLAQLRGLYSKLCATHPRCVHWDGMKHGFETGGQFC